MTALLDELSSLNRKAAEGSTLKRKRCRTLTGRLSNLSMIMPEVVPYLSIGYQLSNHLANHP